MEENGVPCSRIPSIFLRNASEIPGTLPRPEQHAPGMLFTPAAPGPGFRVRPGIKKAVAPDGTTAFLYLGVYFDRTSREGVHFHPKGVHFAGGGFTLFPDNVNNRCMCKNRQFEADNLHRSCNTVLSVFLVLYRPRYNNISRSFA